MCQCIVTYPYFFRTLGSRCLWHFRTGLFAPTCGPALVAGEAAQSWCACECCFMQCSPPCHHSTDPKWTGLHRLLGWLLHANVWHVSILCQPERWLTKTMTTTFLLQCGPTKHYLASWLVWNCFLLHTFSFHHGSELHSTAPAAPLVTGVSLSINDKSGIAPSSNANISAS